MHANVSLCLSVNEACPIGENKLYLGLPYLTCKQYLSPCHTDVAWKCLEGRNI